MSKVVAIAAAAGKKIKFTNIFEAAANSEELVWNTGLATVGDPHIDEIARGMKVAPEANPALVADVNGWTPKHIVGIRLFKNNTFIYLLPGDSIEITCATAEECAYYFGIHDPLLKVEPDFVTEGDDHAAEEEEVKAQLNRTTGIGDADDGNDENGVYPFQFDTEAATKGELEGAAEEEPDPDPEDPENP